MTSDGAVAADAKSERVVTTDVVTTDTGPPEGDTRVLNSRVGE